MGTNYLRYVKLVGTMHVSPESRDRVERMIIEEEPDAVALELDGARLAGMIQGRKVSLVESLGMGRAGALNYLLSSLENKLGKEFGMMPGQEMLSAYRASLRRGIPVYLIDQDVRITLSKMLSIPVREKLILGLDLIAGLFGLGAYEPGDLTDLKELMMEFKRRYPTLHRVLIDERNVVMATNIAAIVDHLKMRGIRKPLVVAVVGMGHVPGMERLLNSWKSGEYL